MLAVIEYIFLFIKYIPFQALHQSWFTEDHALIGRTLQRKDDSCCIACPLQTTGVPIVVNWRFWTCKNQNPIGIIESLGFYMSR